MVSGHELEVQQIGKTTDESSYMIGRFSTDTDTDVSVQLFGQEILNLRSKREGSEQKSVTNSWRYAMFIIFLSSFSPNQVENPLSQIIVDVDVWG